MTLCSEAFSVLHSILGEGEGATRGGWGEYRLVCIQDIWMNSTCEDSAHEWTLSYLYYILCSKCFTLWWGTKSCSSFSWSCLWGPVVETLGNALGLFSYNFVKMNWRKLAGNIVSAYVVHAWKLCVQKYWYDQFFLPTVHIILVESFRWMNLLMLVLCVRSKRGKAM